MTTRTAERCLVLSISIVRRAVSHLCCEQPAFSFFLDWLLRLSYSCSLSNPNLHSPCLINFVQCSADKNGDLWCKVEGSQTKNDKSCFFSATHRPSFEFYEFEDIDFLSNVKYQRWSSSKWIVNHSNGTYASRDRQKIWESWRLWFWTVCQSINWRLIDLIKQWVDELMNWSDSQWLLCADPPFFVHHWWLDSGTALSSLTHSSSED